MWATASAGGDVDTTCAIVGGIVASRVGTEGIPRLAARTPVLEHPHTATVADRRPWDGHLVMSRLWPWSAFVVKPTTPVSSRPRI
ncbi:ADP-ribosylglycohydrolase family protein [Streptomyces sp. NPDC003480]